MNFVKRPIDADLSVGVSVRGLDEQPQRERKWPIHYDSVELLAIVADFEDEAAYRGYDQDAEHNRLRGLLAAHSERVARVQFETSAG